MPGPLNDISNQHVAEEPLSGTPKLADKGAKKATPKANPPSSAKKDESTAHVPSPETSTRVALGFMRAAAAQQPDSDDETCQLHADLFEAELRSMKLKDSLSKSDSQTKKAVSARAAAEKRARELQVDEQLLTRITNYLEEKEQHSAVLPEPEPSP